MPKPSFILRLLLLVFLSGGLWVAAQPAEAQQTVTLSGRVIDAAVTLCQMLVSAPSCPPKGPGGQASVRIVNLEAAFSSQSRRMLNM